MLEKSPKSFFFQKQRQKIDKGTRIYQVNCTVIFRKKIIRSNKRFYDITKELVSKKIDFKTNIRIFIGIKTFFDKVFWKFYT